MSLASEQFLSHPFMLHFLDPATVSLQGRPFLVGFLSFPWDKRRNHSYVCLGWCFLLPAFS
jgi:hypothetical protein